MKPKSSRGKQFVLWCRLVHLQYFSFTLTVGKQREETRLEEKRRRENWWKLIPGPAATDIILEVVNLTTAPPLGTRS